MPARDLVLPEELNSRFNLAPDERLKRRQDYLQAARAGRRLHGPHFSIILSRNETGKRRLGVTVSRRVGGSVERNRVKRRIREFFRLNKEAFPQGHDAVVIAKPGAPSLGRKETDAELAAILARRRPEVTRQGQPGDGGGALS
jgi:ribonuclease P protein component